MKTLLFKPEFRESILCGQKVRTARYWKRKRINAGEHVEARTNYARSSGFARLFIEDVKLWDGKTIDDDHGVREGFQSNDEFWDVFNTINEGKLDEPDREFYLIDFRCEEAVQR